MQGLLLYCRRGFEKECAGEIQQLAGEAEVFGYCRVTDNSGYVVFITTTLDEADRLAKKLPFTRLVFARQMFVVVAHLQELSVDDRISGILAAADPLPSGGELRVETPDTNEAKELLGFCRKFTVPLRKALKDAGKLPAKENSKRPVIHLMMVDSRQGFLGYSYSYNNSPFFMGIPRLKFPSAAPSRSTLKLEEALLLFVPKDKAAERLRSGMKGVDLGACPGGWTYQLVRRGMLVEAVDNGPMADSLMATGQVTHHEADGFKFVPKKPVDWLVCDMVEKPMMVSALMCKWLVNGWCQDAVFNLKLPMKKRFQELYRCFDKIDEVLSQRGQAYELQCKHLYHDREEVTVHVRLTGKR